MAAFFTIFTAALTAFIPAAATGNATTIAPARKPWPEPSCDDPMMNNDLRAVFLNMHNNFRGTLASGQTEKNAGWGVAPPATLMYRMRYDCSVELQALRHASSCNTSSAPLMPGYKENTHVISNIGTNESVAAQNAMTTWWSELARFGVDPNMKFYSKEARRVLNWSKMAWWNNILLGCAVQNCASFYFTVCMYRPGGNNFNQYVYQVGAACFDWPRRMCDRQSLCRW